MFARRGFDDAALGGGNSLTACSSLWNAFDQPRLADRSSLARIFASVCVQVLAALGGKGECSDAQMSTSNSFRRNASRSATTIDPMINSAIGGDE